MNVLLKSQMLFGAAVGVIVLHLVGPLVFVSFCSNLLFCVLVQCCRSVAIMFVSYMCSLQLQSFLSAMGDHRFVEYMFLHSNCCNSYRLNGGKSMDIPPSLEIVGETLLKSKKWLIYRTQGHCQLISVVVVLCIQIMSLFYKKQAIEILTTKYRTHAGGG